MNYYRVVSYILIIIGIVLAVIFSFNLGTSDVELQAINRKINNINTKIAKLEIKIASRKFTNNIQKTVHAEVLEISKIKDEIFNGLGANQNYVRNFVVSVLGIVIAVIGLFTIFGTQYFIERIAFKAEKDLIDRIERKYQIAQGALYNHVAYAEYTRYINHNQKININEEKASLDAAIKSGEYAKKSFEFIENKYLDNDNLRTKCFSFSNLAYYYTLRKNDEDKKDALRYSALAYKIAYQKEIREWYQVIESRAFVLYGYGADNQKDEALNLIDQLLADPSIIDKAFKKDLREDWDDKLNNSS